MTLTDWLIFPYLVKQLEIKDKAEIFYAHVSNSVHKRPYALLQRIPFIFIQSPFILNSYTALSSLALWFSSS